MTTLDALICMILYIMFLGCLVATLTVWFMVKEFLNESR